MQLLRRHERVGLANDSKVATPATMVKAGQPLCERELFAQINMAMPAVANYNGGSPTEQRLLSRVEDRIMATEQWKTAPVVSGAPVSIPPLEQGDRLSRAEFERRYNAMPHLKKAELIEGVVYMPSPVRQERHAGPHSDAIGWLHNYKTATPGIDTGDNATVRLDLDNEPQPDVVLFIEPECGGQVRISEDDYIENAPELVVEIASSSVSYDLDPKLKVYRRNGVREYIVWRVLDNELDWFILREGVYHRQEPGQDGLHKSEVFPGLWLDASALLARRHCDVAKALEAGLASGAHAQFVEQLGAARAD